MIHLIVSTHHEARPLVKIFNLKKINSNFSLVKNNANDMLYLQLVELTL